MDKKHEKLPKMNLAEYLSFTLFSIQKPVDDYSNDFLDAIAACKRQHSGLTTKYGTMDLTRQFTK